MSSRSVVSVQMGGREYRIRSDADPSWLRRVASHVDESMARIRQRTDTVDSLAIATLAALNIARELLELREGQVQSAVPGDASDHFDPDRVRALIDVAEAAASEADG